MGKTGDTSGNDPIKMAAQAPARNDPDLQMIRDQMAKADPQLRAVLEQYLANWFQHNQIPVTVE